MHDLPHCITSSIHQCMFMVPKLVKTPNKHKRDKTMQCKKKQSKQMYTDMKKRLNRG